jgi:hypothetical protein
MQVKENPMGRYLLNILIAIDQLINAVFGGDPDETISSRAGKRYPRLAAFINRLFFWQRNHCQASIEPDEGKDAVL